MWFPLLRAWLCTYPVALLLIIAGAVDRFLVQSAFRNASRKRLRASPTTSRYRSRETWYLPGCRRFRNRTCSYNHASSCSVHTGPTELRMPMSSLLSYIWSPNEHRFSISSPFSRVMLYVTFPATIETSVPSHSAMSFSMSVMAANGSNLHVMPTSARSCSSRCWHARASASLLHGISRSSTYRTSGGAVGSSIQRLSK